MNGLRHGNGKMSFSDSPVAYEGDWKNGMRHGKGKLVFDDAGIIFYDGKDSKPLPWAFPDAWPPLEGGKYWHISEEEVSLELVV